MITIGEAKQTVRETSLVVKHIIEKPFTIVKVTWEDPVDGQVMAAVEVARCSPRDRWSDAMGKEVARGRAEVVIAKRLVRKRNGAPSLISSIIEQMGDVFRSALTYSSP